MLSINVEGFALSCMTVHLVDKRYGGSFLHNQHSGMPSPFHCIQSCQFGRFLLLFTEYGDCIAPTSLRCDK